MDYEKIIDKNGELIRPKYEIELRRKLRWLQGNRQEFILFDDFRKFNTGSFTPMLLIVNDLGDKEWKDKLEEWEDIHPAKFVSGYCRRDKIPLKPDVLKLVARGGNRSLLRRERFLEELQELLTKLSGEGDRAFVLTYREEEEEEEEEDKGKKVDIPRVTRSLMPVWERIHELKEAAVMKGVFPESGYNRLLNQYRKALTDKEPETMKETTEQILDMLTRALTS